MAQNAKRKLFWMKLSARERVFNTTDYKFELKILISDPSIIFHVYRIKF